jgi:hypothetical protein
MRARIGALFLVGVVAAPLPAQGVPVSQPIDSGVVVRLRWGEGSREHQRLNSGAFLLLILVIGPLLPSGHRGRS